VLGFFFLVRETHTKTNTPNPSDLAIAPLSQRAHIAYNDFWHLISEI
jgi:hypothetical protein